MDTSALPSDISEFLKIYIESIGQLEVLLMLKNNPSQEWEAQQVSRELRSNVTSATSKLQQLASKNLIKVTSNQKFIYAASQDLDAIIINLQILYLERPVSIITFIYDKPTDILKGFADAFKFKKD